MADETKAPQIENPEKITAKDMDEMDYIYLGDRLTRPELRRMPCRAVRRSDGKCIRGRNGNMLVEFGDVGKCVVLGRLLRKIKK